MMRVDVKPELLRWACDRAGVEPADLAENFPKLPEWLRAESQPTLKQLERFAKTTHTPLGYLFLPDPPREQLPIPDMRTMGSTPVRRPSPDLLDTIYTCQQRQEWYQEFARLTGEGARRSVGTASIGDDVVTTADSIRAALGFDLDARKQMGTWESALRRFIEQADDLGVLVMVSGIVGSNTRRKLDPEEFRGFALADSVAPVVFINGADTKSAQMFTLAHELAHIWAGATALSDAAPGTVPTHEVERWCNEVAAELLVPIATFREEYRPKADLHDELTRLARRFKVSTLVILRRMHDAGGLSKSAFWKHYRAELQRLLELGKGGSGGGNFYNTLPVRVSKRFARAIVVSTLEGQTLHRDAFRLLGFSKLETFRELGHSLGIV